MATGPAEGIISLIASATPAIGDMPPATTTGWRLGVGKLLGELPDQQIVAFDIHGQLPNPLWLLDYPVVQLIVRAGVTGYQAGFQKLRDCYDVLLGIPPQTIGGDRWDAITVLSTPAFMGNDDKDRPQFTANFRIILEPAASTYSNRRPLGE